MRLLIEVEVTEAEAAKICSNSLERVINSSIRNADDTGDVVNGDDWRELKSIVMRLWHGVTDSVRRYKAIARPPQIPKPTLVDYYVCMAAYDKLQLVPTGSSLAHYGVWLQGLTAEEHRRINEEADKHYPMGGEK